MFRFLTILVMTVASISFIGLFGTTIVGMSRSARELARLNYVPTGEQVRQIRDRAYGGRHKKWLKSILICMPLFALFRFLDRMFG